MNLVESLLHALKDHGARQIFGIPGDFALPYFRIINGTVTERMAVQWMMGIGVPQ